MNARNLIGSSLRLQLVVPAPGGGGQCQTLTTIIGMPVLRGEVEADEIKNRDRTPLELAFVASACARGKGDEKPETLNQPGTNSG